MKMSKANQRKAKELLEDLSICAQLAGKHRNKNETEEAYWSNERSQAYARLVEFLGITI
jgi:hypothetical protein